MKDVMIMAESKDWNDGFIALTGDYVEVAPRPVKIRGVRRPPPNMHDRLQAGDWARLGYLARYRMTGNAEVQLVGVVKQVHGTHRQAHVDVALAPHGVVRVTQDDIAERAWLDGDGEPAAESTEGPPRIWAHLHQGR